MTICTELRNHMKAVIISVILVILVIGIGIGVAVFYTVKHKNAKKAEHDQHFDKEVHKRSLHLEESQIDALDEHNRLRALHGAPPLVMDTELNKIAIQCAMYYESIRTIDHSCPWKKKNGQAVGENLFMVNSHGKVPNYDDRSLTLIGTKDWYDEIKLYNFNKQGFTMATGHFTAMVWKEVKEFGIGVYKTNNGAYVAAIYLPQPNILGKFEENVAKPIAA